MNKWLVAMTACVSLCACSSDDAGVNTPGNVFTGDEAYITIRLNDPASTRASFNENYENGSEAEHAVNTAHFYFYDDDKVFVAEGSAWNGGTATNPDQNVEFKGNNVIVLKGLTNKEYPKYLVTVLNRPASFTPATTLDGLLEQLSDANGVGIKNGDNFVMSTSSYVHTPSTEPYMVTVLKASDFSTEPVSNSYSAVDVYVERLAAKVSMAVNMQGVTIANKTMYKLQATVAGDLNDNSDNSIAAEDLYVEFLGWKLNATAKQSKMMKNINDTWTEAALGFAWNKAGDYRSFWGKSFNYDIDSYTYPASAAAYDANETGYALHYVNLQTVNAMDAVEYCAENTNTADIVNANFPSAVTSVLLKARICDAEGNPLNLVRHEGVLFKMDHFQQYILNVANAKGNLNAYVKTGDDTYTQVSAANTELVNKKDGNVIVQLVDGTYYDKEGVEPTSIATVNAALENECTNTVAYTGGEMYYNIPIEHFNDDRKADGFEGAAPEASWGIVRNHYYVVTINSLSNLGKGIFDPEEVIIPSPEDTKAYYLDADIHILSWKLVNQGVDL